MKYNPAKIERKWQRIWEKVNNYGAQDFSRKPKLYILVEFPYPSGSGLHVGHCRQYVALDAVSRKKRMEGFNVLYPMGWDAFGLPTENYAIKTGIHPRIATKRNTTFFKKQQKSLGLSFDRNREIDTTDPAYYKWTQWIFLQLFKKGLAYKAKIPINWCPACKIGLANEEVINGACERCGAEVTKKERFQWMLKITNYAERLIEDLGKVDYPERVKILQKEWIGRSEGVEIKFPVSGSQFSIDVFTTRIDTIFGATYLVIAPEHPIIEKLKDKIKNSEYVKEYIEKAKAKLERERIAKKEEKTGVKIEGVKVINPATEKEIPIFVAEYVLMHYGTGAVMAVPCHDERDFSFAREHNLPFLQVIKPFLKKEQTELFSLDGMFQNSYEGEGILMNSEKFDGLRSNIARERIREYFEKKGLAKKAIHYKLRDWVFSRQRYWGEPIPLIFCQECKKLVESFKLQVSSFKNKERFNKGELLNPGWFAVLERDLPVELPNVKEYKPTEEGESPLANVKKWVNTRCPKCGSPAQRETDVMPNWAGSNWYFLRYCDPKNDKKLAGPRKLKYWMPVDWYNGGMEHVTLHLLYSRFIYKFLWDIGAVPKELGPEPYKKRTSHGIVLAGGGVKMSKSKGNVINPEEIVKEFGADTMRIYEMFMGPFEQAIAWDTKGVKGVRRFLEKAWNLSFQFLNSQDNKGSINLKRLLQKTIKKVSEDIDNLKFNTAVSCLMEFCNAWLQEKDGLREKDFQDFLKVLCPFAPHLAEDLWQSLHQKNLKDYKIQDSIFSQKWPKYDKNLIEEERITLIIQINGKVRDTIEISRDVSESQAKKFALSQSKIKKWTEGKKIEKVIFVKNKLINFVIS